MTKKRVIWAVIGVAIAALAVYGFAVDEEFRALVLSIGFALLVLAGAVVAYHIRA